MKIERNTVKEIQAKVRDYINSLEKEYGIEVTKNSASYTDADLKLSISVRLKSDRRDESITTREEQRYDLEASLNPRLPKRGSFVSIGTEEFQIKEWILRGRKYQISGINVVNNKSYKLTVSQVQSGTVVR